MRVLILKHCTVHQYCLFYFEFVNIFALPNNLIYTKLLESTFLEKTYNTFNNTFFSCTIYITKTSKIYPNTTSLMLIFKFFRLYNDHTTRYMECMPKILFWYDQATNNF